MGRHPNYVNEQYFDSQSRAMYYVLGAFYAKASPRPENGITFQCSSRDLVQIVKEQLDSKHKIISDPRGKPSHWLRMRSVPYMRSRLDELGFLKHKSERRVPKNIPKKYVSHFARGFIDAKAQVRVTEDGRTNVRISFYEIPLKDIHELLVEYAGIKHPAPKGNKILYGHKNSIRMHDFIYRDWEYIKEYGIYLPSKKEAFRTEYEHVHPPTLAVQRKMDIAKKMLRDGYPPKTIAEMLGYSSVLDFYARFKKVTGKTVNEFRGRRRLWHN